MCNCNIEIPEKLKSVNNFHSVQIDLHNVTKRVFTTFTIVENKGDAKQRVPMPCKFCPFCGEKFELKEQS